MYFGESKFGENKHLCFQTQSAERVPGRRLPNRDWKKIIFIKVLIFLYATVASPTAAALQSSRGPQWLSKGSRNYKQLLFRTNVFPHIILLNLSSFKGGRCRPVKVCSKGKNFFRNKGQCKRGDEQIYQTMFFFHYLNSYHLNLFQRAADTRHLQHRRGIEKGLFLSVFIHILFRFILCDTSCGFHIFE